MKNRLDTMLVDYGINAPVFITGQEHIVGVMDDLEIDADAVNDFLEKLATGHPTDNASFTVVNLQLA